MAWTRLKSIGAAAAALLALASGGLARPATAAPIQLGFILDSSGSIGSGNWNIIRTGLANAINTIVPADGSYEISVVTFSSSASAIVNHVLINSAATRNTVANTIATASFLQGGTNFAAAFDAMSNALTGSALGSTTAYVNFATDGVPNIDGNGVTQRNNLIANAGVDNLSIEGIGSGVNKNFLKTSICSPSPCTESPTFIFPGQGFYIGVNDAQGYADAIGNKIMVVTNTPEPATLALLGVGLTAMGVIRRRRRG